MISLANCWPNSVSRGITPSSWSSWMDLILSEGSSPWRYWSILVIGSYVRTAVPLNWFVIEQYGPNENIQVSIFLNVFGNLANILIFMRISNLSSVVSDNPVVAFNVSMFCQAQFTTPLLKTVDSFPDLLVTVIS